MKDEVTPDIQAKLELLEKRIRQLLTLVKDLKIDNSRLSAELTDVQDQLGIVRTKEDQIQQTLAEAEQWKAEVQELKNSRDQVARKIENLLGQIDGLQEEFATD